MAKSKKSKRSSKNHQKKTTSDSSNNIDTNDKNGNSDTEKHSSSNNGNNDSNNSYSTNNNNQSSQCNNDNSSGHRNYSINGSSSNNNSGSSTSASPLSSSSEMNHHVHHHNHNGDDLTWLRECDNRHDSKGQPYLQLEYRDDDIIMLHLRNFLENSSAKKQVVDEFYQIWQHTVLSTLLEMSALWQKENVTPDDQRHMKDRLKKARYKVSFLLHRVMGGMLTSNLTKWKHRRDDLLQVCLHTLQLLPRLAESCPHHKTDIRQVIIHFEGKEFLASCACETWDTLYDHSIPLDPNLFVPILRRCAMLDILDKDWNMLGGWEDILKALEAKCFVDYNNNNAVTNNSYNTNGSSTGAPVIPVPRLPSDVILQETTTILRNARNSMQCKFFSVRFLRYTDDQAPQRWRYFPKCSAPACANIETPSKIHQLRCSHCHYFHYCSYSCQEYCDSIMGLHPKFCKDTPREKSEQCRKEMEQYLGLLSEDDNATFSASCHACGLHERFVVKNKNSNIPSQPQLLSQQKDQRQQQGGGGMKRCSQCQKVYYCSRQCQEWDWRVGGHKQICSKANKSPTKSAPASMVEDDCDEEEEAGNCLD